MATRNYRQRKAMKITGGKNPCSARLMECRKGGPFLVIGMRKGESGMKLFFEELFEKIEDAESSFHELMQAQIRFADLIQEGGANERQQNI